MPSELYDYVNTDVYARILEKLMYSQSVDVEQFVDDCIYYSCNWMSAHIMGSHKLDQFMTMEEIINSFRQECPNTCITQISQDSCKITLSDSYWTIHRNSWAGDTPIRLSYKYHTHRSFVLMNESPAILKHVNSLIPEFRKMIQKHILDANRQILVTLIKKTADKAAHSK